MKGAHRLMPLLLVVGCAHAPPAAPSADVLDVTEVAARYALAHDVPPVLRQPSGVCLEVDGQPPPREVLQRLSTGGVQVFPGAAGCLGPRPLLLQVNAVVVSGNSASAHAGVQQGRSGALTLHRVRGEWQVQRPPGPASDGPQLSLP